METEHIAELERLLARREPGVRCVFSHDPRELPEVIEKLSERAPVAFTVVSIRGEPGTGLAEHLEQAVDMLAEAVLVRHPLLGRSASWQLQAAPFDAPNSEQCSLTCIAQHVPARWWDRVLVACRSGRRPRCRDYPLTVEAGRLALCLDPEYLVLVWVTTPHPSSPQMLGLARAAEWLASSTRASVFVSLGSSHVGRAELDSISYQALVCAADTEAPDRQHARDAVHDHLHLPTEIRKPRDTEREAVECGGEARKASPPRITGLWPVIGRPHPLSPAELRFAELLAADPELSGEFAWNQVVVTRQDTRPIVDLLCRTRRLVVEIDGFTHHGTRTMFERDRQRDWELMISGYRVLRIAASEVLADAPRSLEKLRTLMRSLAGET